MLVWTHKDWAALACQRLSQGRAASVAVLRDRELDGTQSQILAKSGENAHFAAADSVASKVGIAAELTEICPPRGLSEVRVI